MGGKNTRPVAPEPMTAEQQREAVSAKLEKLREKRKKEEENKREHIKEMLKKADDERRKREEYPARDKREAKKVADANIGINLRNAGNPISLVRPHKDAVRKMKVAPAGLDLFVDK